MSVTLIILQRSSFSFLLVDIMAFAFIVSGRWECSGIQSRFFFFFFSCPVKNLNRNFSLILECATCSTPLCETLLHMQITGFAVYDEVSGD